MLRPVALLLIHKMCVVNWLNVQCSLVLVGQMAVCVYVAAILFLRMSNSVCTYVHLSDFMYILNVLLP